MIQKVKRTISWLLILSLAGILIGFPPLANAAGSLSSASDTLSRLKASQSADHYVKFTIGTTDTIKYYRIEFSNDWDLSSPVSPTLEIKVGGVDKSADGAWTFDNTTDDKNAEWAYDTPIEVSSSTVIELWFESVGNPSSGGASYTLTFRTQTSVPADIDTAEVSVYILTDEQVAVSGTVSSTISFAITAPADLGIGFGTLSATQIRYPTDDEQGTTEIPGNDLPIKLTASTNAGSGLTITISSTGDGSSNAGLYSSATSEIIDAKASTLVAGTEEGYGVYAKNEASLTIDEGFDHDSSSDLAIDVTALRIAYTAAEVSSGTVDVLPLAAIASTTPAGTYSDTLTLICTGNF